MGPSGQDPAGNGRNLTIDLQALEVHIPVPGGETVRVDPRVHREDVVRRLLLLGVSDRTLVTLLPDWVALIDRVAASIARS